MGAIFFSSHIRPYPAEMMATVHLTFSGKLYGTETPTRHLLDSLIKAMTDYIEMIEAQIAACRRKYARPKFCQPTGTKALETRQICIAQPLTNMYS
jgi:hypothetical protein